VEQIVTVRERILADKMHVRSLSAQQESSAPCWAIACCIHYNTSAAFKARSTQSTWRSRVYSFKDRAAMTAGAAD
jgi:hypothetical protein